MMQAEKALRRGTVRCGVDAAGPWVELNDEVLRLPKWSCLGGLELTVSADERYGLLFLYSGQSSQGYELFSLEPGLRLLPGLREVHGLGDAPAFSSEGSWVAALIDCERKLRATGEWFEEVQDDDASDRVIVEWARVHFQRPGEAAQHFGVDVEVPRNLDLDVFFEWQPYDVLRFVDDNQLELALPWGEPVRVELPRATPVTGKA